MKEIVQTNKQIPGNLLLGYLYFYTLGDVMISEKDLQQEIMAVNIDKKFIKAISPNDLFRRVTSEKKEDIPITINGSIYQARLNIDEVHNSNDYVERVLGRKIIDKKNKAVAYKQAARIIFDKKTKGISEVVDKNMLQEYNYQSIIDGIKGEFKLLEHTHNRQTLRNQFTRIIESMHPINLLPSGICKFIPKQYRDNLYNFKDLINNLDQYTNKEGNLFEVIPVVDTVEQRRSVGNAAQNEIANDLNALREGIKESIAKNGELGKKAINSYKRRYDELYSKNKDYLQVLGTEFKGAAKALEEAIELDIEKNGFK